MAKEEVVYAKGNRFFINRINGKLYHATPKAAPSFAKRIKKYKEITRGEHKRLRQKYLSYDKRMDTYLGFHRGQTIHVFGNGPSLNEFARFQDWSNRITIGVNAAGSAINRLTYWVSVDNLWDKRCERPLHLFCWEWLRENKGITKQFLRLGATLDTKWNKQRVAEGEPPLYCPDEIFRHAPGPMERPGKGLFYQTSSTHAAMDLARHMGAKRIIIWGVDYNDRSHCYTNQEIKGDLKDNPGQQWADWLSIESGWKKIYSHCKSTGVDVWLANPKSRLKFIPVIEPVKAWEL